MGEKSQGNKSNCTEGEGREEPERQERCKGLRPHTKVTQVVLKHLQLHPAPEENLTGKGAVPLSAACESQQLERPTVLQGLKSTVGSGVTETSMSQPMERHLPTSLFPYLGVIQPRAIWGLLFETELYWGHKIKK